MQVDIITTYAEFENLNSNWDVVYEADPKAQFFLSWGWLSQVFSQYPKGWFILAVKPDGLNRDYIAFFPLRLKTHQKKSSRESYNEISVAGRYFWADYSGFICLPDHEDEAIPQFTSQLKQMQWREFRLKNLFISDKRLEIFVDQFDKKTFSLKYLETTNEKDNVNFFVCPYVELPDDFGQYQKEKLSANTRQKMRRFLRRVDESDELKITHSVPETHERDLDILIGFWKKKWALRKGSNVDRLATKYRKILQRGLENDSLYLPVLWLGDEPVGALGSFIDRQKLALLYFIAGRDESCNNPPPGLVLHAHSIRWAIENGLKTYDFLRGNEDFKYSYGATDNQIRYPVISTRSGINLNSTTDSMVETSDAIAWARQFFVHEAVDEVANHPWGRTLKLSHDKSQAYLKMIPSGKPHRIKIAQILADQCPLKVPGVIATDAERGLLLLADHGGRDLGRNVTDLQRNAILGEYAEIQSRAKSSSVLFSALPRVDLPRLVPDFLDFLSPEPLQHADGRVNASYFLGRSSAKRYQAVFSELAERLDAFIMLASPLPVTLSHGDLRPQNIAVGEDGHFIFYDWDDASIAPLGLSLHTQFSGCCRPYVALSASDKDSTPQVERDRKLLDGYINAAAVIAKPAVLQEELPSAICAGVLYYLMSYRDYPGESYNYRRTIRSILKNRLSDLMDLCQLLVVVDDDVEASRQLAKVYSENGRDHRARLLDLSLENQNSNFNQQVVHTAKTDIQKVVSNSDAPGVFPTLFFAQEELRTGKPSNETIERGVSLFRRHGVLYFDNVMSKLLLENCHSHIVGNYAEYFTEETHGDALRVGEKRYMITLQVEQPFDDPALFASPLVTPVLERLLGEKMILGSYTTVVSLPGAKAQRLHKDHPAMFPESEEPTPSFAITLIIPLVHLDATTGATNVVKGSHRCSSKEAKKMLLEEPLVPLGSCFLMDYRLSHRGAGNHSNQIRPILSLVYQRPWFRDFVNYKKQKPLDIGQDALNKIPRAYSRLFDWT